MCVPCTTSHTNLCAPSQATRALNYYLGVSLVPDSQVLHEVYGVPTAQLNAVVNVSQGVGVFDSPGLLHTKKPLTVFAIYSAPSPLHSLPLLAFSAPPLAPWHHYHGRAPSWQR